MKISKTQLKKIISETLALEETRYRGKKYRSKEVLDDMTYGDSGDTEFYTAPDPIKGKFIDKNNNERPIAYYYLNAGPEAAKRHASAQIEFVIKKLGLDPAKATYDNTPERKMGELQKLFNKYGYMIDYDIVKRSITFENKDDTSDPYTLDVSYLAASNPMNESFKGAQRRRRIEYEMQDPGYYSDDKGYFDTPYSAFYDTPAEATKQTEPTVAQINTPLEDLPIHGAKDGSFEAKLDFGKELNAAWKKAGEDPYFFFTKRGHTAVYFGPSFKSYQLSNTDAKVYLNAGIELIYFDKGGNEVVSNMMTRFAR